MGKTIITIEIEHDEDMPNAGVYSIFHDLEWGAHTTLADLVELKNPADDDRWILQAQMTAEDGYFWCKNATMAAYEMARLSQLQWPTESACGMNDWFEFMHDNSAYGRASENADDLIDHLFANDWWIDEEFEQASRKYLDSAGAWLSYCECTGDPDHNGYLLQYNE